MRRVIHVPPSGSNLVSTWLLCVRSGMCMRSTWMIPGEGREFEVFAGPTEIPAFAGDGKGKGKTRTARQPRAQYGELPDIARDGKHFLRARSHADVFCEIRPTHDTGTIDEEFGRTGDIVAIRSRGGMQKIVTADYVKVGIREKREGVPGLAAQVRGNLGRVDADGDGANAERLEILELLLDAS